MNSKVSQVINQLKPYKPEKIILFGSHVSGKPTAQSNIDIILIKKTADSFDQRLKEVRGLMRTTTPVDIFVFTPQEFESGLKTNLFIGEAAKTGKVVYG